MADTYRADTLLAVDFGTATTRVSLFDVVEDRYRYVASGEAPSTHTPPYLEASEGMRHAITELQAITGRTLLDDGSRLIIPSSPEGAGTDLFAATASAGPALRAVLVGLLPDVSLESARRVAASSYISVVETFSLGDRRRDEQRIDAVLTVRPELFLIAGGTDGGAQEALLRLLENVALACHLLPAGTQAKVLYMGNAALKDRVAEMLGGVAAVHSAPNVRPELEDEDLAPARAELARVFEELRFAQIGGFMQLAQLAGGHIRPTAHAEGQILRCLSRRPEGARGVLGVSVGSASTSLAAAFKGELSLSVRPDLGVGVHAPTALAETPVSHFARWLPFETTEAAVRDFAWNKRAHPHTVPADLNDLYLEQALARQVMRVALHNAHARWSGAAAGMRGDRLPELDLILGSGAVLSRSPRPGLTALMLLDGLQPAGVTALVLDSHHLAAALGAAAYLSPMAAAQVIESGAFLNLGTAVSAAGRAQPGEVVCQARLVTEAGAEQAADVQFGTLEVMSLPLGQGGKLTLKPRAGIDVGFGPGRGKTVTVKGGTVGVIIDARGRPIVFPEAADKRAETVQQWILKAGGM